MRYFNVIGRNRNPLTYLLQEISTKEKVAATHGDVCQLAKQGQLKNATYNKSTHTLSGMDVDLRSLPTYSQSNSSHEVLQWCFYWARWSRTAVEWWYLLYDKDKNKANAFKEYLSKFNQQMLTSIEQLYAQNYGGWFLSQWKPMSEIPQSKWLVGKNIYSPKDIEVVYRERDGTVLACVNGAKLYIYDTYYEYEHDKHAKYEGLSTVLLHEIGHILSEMHPQLGQLIIHNPYNALGRYNAERNFFDGNYGEYTPEEAWAQSFAYYLITPSHLKANYPMGYKFVDTMVKQMPQYKECIHRISEMLVD